MIPRWPTEQRNVSVAAAERPGDPGCAIAKGQLETGRLSRSNSFGSLGGLVKFVYRLGKDDGDCQRSSSPNDICKDAPVLPRKKLTRAAEGSSACEGSDIKAKKSYKELLRRERLKSGIGTSALPLSFLFRSNTDSARPSVPARQNSTPNLLPSLLQGEDSDDSASTAAAKAASTGRSRRNSLFKHNSDSHLQAMLEDKDIDHVVSLKLLLAEAKSEADVTGMQCADLMKKNALLEQRLVNSSARIAELESELQLHTTFARRMPNNKQKLSRLEETNRTLQRQLTVSRFNPAAESKTSSASSRLASDVGVDLELSIMRRRVQDLERQNRMLRSELVGAGRELDEHRQQSSSSLDVTEMHLPADDSDLESEDAADAEAGMARNQDIHQRNSKSINDGNEINTGDHQPEDLSSANEEEETFHKDNGQEARRRYRQMSASSSNEMHIFAFGSMSSATTNTTATTVGQVARESAMPRQQQRRASSLDDVQEGADEEECGVEFGTLQPPVDDGARARSRTASASSTEFHFLRLFGSVSSDTTMEAAPTPPLPAVDTNNAHIQQIGEGIGNPLLAQPDTSNVGVRRPRRLLSTNDEPTGFSLGSMANEVHVFRSTSVASVLTTQTDESDRTSSFSDVLGH